MNQKKLAKQLVPILQRYREISNTMNDSIPISQIKLLAIELADLFLSLLRVAGKNGFPAEKVNSYSGILIDIKSKLANTQDETFIKSHTTYLIINFQALCQSLGV